MGTAQRLVITLVVTVTCRFSLSPGMATIYHMANKDDLSAFIGPADHFEYTEVNVKPN